MAPGDLDLAALLPGATVAVLGPTSVTTSKETRTSQALIVMVIIRPPHSSILSVSKLFSGAAHDFMVRFGHKRHRSRAKQRAKEL